MGFGFFGFLGFWGFWIFEFLVFWIFGRLDFWMPVFWILVDICTPGTAFLCTVGARVRQRMPSIYAFYIYIYTCALAKPGFCNGGNRKVVHCSVPVLVKTMIVKA